MTTIVLVRKKNEVVVKSKVDIAERVINNVRKSHKSQYRNCISRCKKN